MARVLFFGFGAVAEIPFVKYRFSAAEDITVELQGDVDKSLVRAMGFDVEGKMERDGRVTKQMDFVVAPTSPPLIDEKEDVFF